MYKPAYFYLSFLNVATGLVVSLLIIKFFGALGDADAYFMGVAVVAAVHLLQLMMVDQFIYFYQERRAQSATLAARFAATVLMQCSLVSVGVALLLWQFGDSLLTLFAVGFDAARREATLGVLAILAWNCLMFPANFVIHRLLNTESKYSLTYFFELLTPLSALGVLVYFWVSDNAEIRLLAYARVAGLLLSLLLGIVTAWRLGFIRRAALFSASAFDCYRNSFTMRIGHNFHNFLFSPITNTVLSLLPQGSVAIYYYAERLAQIVSAVVAGPFQRVFQVEVGERWRKREPGSIVSMQRSYVLRVAALYSLATAATFLALPVLLDVVNAELVSARQVRILQWMYLAVAGWVGLIAIEFAFVSVGLAAKKSKLFFWVNLLFIVSYGALCLLSREKLGIFVVPLAAITAQAVSFVIFFRYVRGLLARAGESQGVQGRIEENG